MLVEKAYCEHLLTNTIVHIHFAPYTHPNLNLYFFNFSLLGKMTYSKSFLQNKFRGYSLTSLKFVDGFESLKSFFQNYLFVIHPKDVDEDVWCIPENKRRPRFSGETFSRISETFLSSRTSKMFSSQSFQCKFMAKGEGLPRRRERERLRCSNDSKTLKDTKKLLKGKKTF